MRTRLLTVTAIALLGCLTAGAAAMAAGKADTKVTIKAQSDGFFGYVKSSDANNCANGRKVILYKQKGDSPDRQADTKIGSDTAQANGDKYMWSTGNTGKPHGDYYAFAKHTTQCKADYSRTVST
jgi:hypothetical protein